MLFYLDNLIIFSSSFREHLERLQQVFQRIRNYSIKLTLKKCPFCMKKVKYMGHIVSKDGVEPDSEKISEVKNWPIPSNSDQVRQFLILLAIIGNLFKILLRLLNPSLM